VIKNASMTLREGEILSILGPNGAGKTTLLNCMIKLITPSSGEIFLRGTNIRDMSAREVACIAGYVPQSHVPVFGYTVLNFVMMGRAPKIGVFKRPCREDEDAAFEALETLNIAHLANRPYTDISGGERQQATIARAIAQNPSVILFDEPTAHLDYGNQHRILLLLRSMAHRGFSVVLTTHNPDHAVLLGGSAAALDRDGHLAAGESKDVITEARLMNLYKTNLRMTYVPDVSRTVCVTPSLDPEVHKNELQLL
jgi:iron complex transport system ATP-binding protein